MYYGITSESQLIDIGTIQSAVEKIKKTAEDFGTCANFVKEAAAICNAEALEVDGLTMQPEIEEIAGLIEKMETKAKEDADSILAMANQIYNTQNAELQAYREKLRREAEEKSNG